MQPTALISALFPLTLVGVPAQEEPTVRPARAVEEPADAANPVPTTDAKTDKPGKPPSDAQATKPGPTAPPSPAEASAGAAMNAAALLPIGVPSFDVRMPEFDEERLISRVKVRELTRIDNDHLDMRDMNLERYLPTGGIDYVVLVERGFYELSTGRLVSSSPTRLRGKSIDLHGEGCVYSRDAEVIKILGKVTSYIYVEKGQLSKSKDPVPAEDVPKAPTTPNTRVSTKSSAPGTKSPDPTPQP